MPENEPTPIVLVEDPPEPDPVVTPQADPSKRRQPSREPTWEDVERAREEEKNKLYPRLEKVDEMEAELKALRDERAAAERDRKKREKEAEDARLAAEREKMNAQELVESYKAEQEARFQEMQERLEREQLLREKERQFSELLSYKAARMAEEGEAIMPQLRDLVRGNTPDEIDASIEDLKARTASVMGEVQAGIQSVRSGMPMSRPTGAPATGPLDLNGSPRELTLDDLRNMSAEDYAANREALHQAVARARRG